MKRSSSFSYRCNQCGRCCHNQVITLSPYDVIRLARAARVTTGEAIVRYTIRLGSILKFNPDGSCAALDGTVCTVHADRPLACRLYPLGLEYDERRDQRYLRVEPATGSLGSYGKQGTVRDFLASQDADIHLQMNLRYAALLSIFQQRILELIDFEITEPREFWRVAVREALAETNFDFNPIINALFDPDSLPGETASELDPVERHVKQIERMIRDEEDPSIVAAAAALLAVSLGYSPSALMPVIGGKQCNEALACRS